MSFYRITIPHHKIPNELNPLSYNSIAEFNTFLSNNLSSDTIDKLKIDLKNNEDALLTILKTINVEDLEKHVDSPYGFKIGEFFKFMLEHSNNHLQQIIEVIQRSIEL